MKRLLCLDPGSTKSAWIIYQPGHKQIINGFGIEENEKVARRISDMTLSFDEVICERVSGFMGGYGDQKSIGKDIIDTAIWIGRYWQAAEYSSKIFITMSRKTIAAKLTGMAKYGDKEVRAALIKRFGEPGTIKAPGLLYGVSRDLWAALGVGVAFCDMEVTKPVPVQPTRDDMFSFKP